MHYFSRSFIQQPLKISQKPNKNQPAPNASYQKSYKKSIGNNNLNISQNQKSRLNNQNYLRCKTPSVNKPEKIVQKKSKEISQFQSNSNSIEELLNSSVNQLEKLMSLPSNNQTLEQQNSRLKIRVSQMKNIIKEKLEAALKKQKQQISKILQDYISLITKLLQDKQELSLKIEQLGYQNKRKLHQKDQYWSKRFQSAMWEKDQQLMGARAQIQQLISIIENYKQQSHQDQIILKQMNKKIQQLERKRNQQDQQTKQKIIQRTYNQSHLQLKIRQQQTKIKTLMQLLEKSQTQIYHLKTQIDQFKQKNLPKQSIDIQNSEIVNKYERQIEQIEQQHYQQFVQYQKAIKQTLANKDQYIQKLNSIIEGLRQRKNHQ